MEVNSHKCRACLSENDVMWSLFEVYEHDITLGMILQSCIAREVSENDGLPSHLCDSCTKVLIRSYNFTVVYEESDQELRKLPKDREKLRTIDQSGKLEENFENLVEVKEAETIETNELLNEIIAVELTQETVMTNCASPASLEFHEYDTISNCCEEQERMEVPNYSLEDVETIQEFRKEVPKAAEGMDGVREYTRPVNKFIKSEGVKDENVLDCHEGNKKYMCEVCGVRFIRKTYLDDHMERHSTEKKHRCKFCDKAFKLRTVLRAHKRIHTHPNHYICEHCGHAFTNSTTLKTHKLSIHEKTRNYQCVICNRFFSLKSTLNKHVLRHQKRENGEKGFNCTQCEMQYRDKSSLKRHIDRKHEGNIQVIVCSDCPKKYTSKTTLMKHRRRHHTATAVETVL